MLDRFRPDTNDHKARAARLCFPPVDPALMPAHSSQLSYQRGMIMPDPPPPRITPRKMLAAA